MLLTYNVINLHLTEICNYRCSYCFAKFNVQNELGIDAWKQVVDQIKNYFDLNAIKDGRINLAGGEPLLLNYLDKLIDYIHSLNIKVSIITNASLLSKEKIDRWTDKIDILGISIDSLKHETNLTIGRENKGDTVDYNHLVELLNYAKAKGIKLKVNTVISKLNYKEDITKLYEDVNFDRIKILQMRVNKHCNETASDLSISDQEFIEYCDKFDDHNIVFESESDMESSYIFIDPKGNMISNENHTHNRIGSILEEDIIDLINKTRINQYRFKKRYITKMEA